MKAGIAAFIAGLLLASCAETATTPATKPGDPARQITGDDLDRARESYYQALENGTRRVRIQYDRVDTASIYWATLDTDAIRSFRRDALAVYELWTPERAESEKQKDAEESAKSLAFSIVLYTEDQRDNLIGLASGSPVKASLLQPDGKRIEPSSIQKLETPRSRIEWLYPHKDRFSTVWLVKFPRPEKAGPVELQITGTRFSSATTWEAGSAAVAAPAAP